MRVSKENTRRRRPIRKQMMVLAMALLLLGQVITTKEDTVYGASASVGFEEMAMGAVAGQEMTIYLVVRTDESLGDFSADISYDTSYLEYISGPSFITGGDGILSLSDVGASESAETRRYALTFKVLKSGVTRLSASGDLSAYEYETGNAMSISSRTYILSIADEKNVSDDASLGVLKINPGSLSPSFEADILEYNTSVDLDTKSLAVSALANDANAVVSVIGQNDLKEGQNQVYIEVTAESGATRVYTIYVTKEAKADGIQDITGTNIPSLKEDEIPEKENTGTIQESTEKQEEADLEEMPTDSLWNVSENRIEAYRENEDTVIAGQYRYHLADNRGNVNIPDGYEESVLLLNGITIPAYVKAGEEDPDTMLLVLQDEDGEVNLYRYDRIEKTMQKISDDVLTVTSEERIEELSLQLARLTKKYQQNVERMGLIAAGLIMALAGLSAGWLISSRKKKQDREWQ